MAKEKDWVKIHSIVLKPEERTQQIPTDTQSVPLEMWVKGYLLSDAQLGEEVKIQTVTGRIEVGTLVEVFPTYTHSFGKFIPEILEIDELLQQELEAVRDEK